LRSAGILRSSRTIQRGLVLGTVDAFAAFSLPALGTAYAMPVSTIEELEADRWPDPGSDSTYLIRRCAALRRKPLSDFTIEDMRIMIGQQIGLSALLPRAVSILVHDPLAEGDYYPGDLLAVVVGLPAGAWAELNEQRQQLVQALADMQFDALDAETRSATRRFMQR
jgi:hypothetical protein